MSDARELVGNAIADEWMKHTARNRRLPGSNQLADAAIAAFAEAAKTPEVVEAVRDRIKSIVAEPYIKDRFDVYYEMYAHEVIKAMFQAIATKGADNE